MYARAGAGPPAMVTFSKNVGAARNRLLLRDADAADGATRTGDLESRDGRLFEPDALEDRVRAEAAGELADALDRLVASLADDVRRAELLARARSGRHGGRG